MEIQFVEKHYHGRMPAIEVTKASKEFHEFISDIMYANRMDDPDYIAKAQANPFFQGGHDFKGSEGWILIECWSSIGKAEEFYQYVMAKWDSIKDVVKTYSGMCNRCHTETFATTKGEHCCKWGGCNGTVII